MKASCENGPPVSASGEPAAAEAALPLVIAHRGASAGAPENTLAAFELARRHGADGIEFDVRLAADGVPVVIHDATLMRTARRRGAVASLPSAELARLDAGSWFNRRHPARARADFSGEGVPTLALVLDLFGPRFSALYLELKCSAAERRALVGAAVSVLRSRQEIARRVAVESFDLGAVAEVKLLAPGQRTAALFERKLRRPSVTAREMIARARDCGADEIALHRSLVTRHRVEAARAAGLPAVVWTVDHPAWAGRARELGLRALITNRPARLLAALDPARAAPAADW